MSYRSSSRVIASRSRPRAFASLAIACVVLLACFAAPVASVAAACGDTLVDAGSCPPLENEPSDPGSALPGLLPRSSAGNPVSLLGGNKRQTETDYAVPGSELVFHRHYNSLNTDWSVGLGQGWHHTYAVSLFDAGDGVREIVQSDGRRLRFTPAGTDEAGRERLTSGAPNEGQLRVVDGDHEWRLPDGRRLRFRGSYLVTIDWPDQRRLSLHYRQRRLESVTDGSGRQLRFVWTPGQRGLPGYDAMPFGEQAGHLASVTLPDGSAIGYDYDERRNLTRVRYPDGTSRRYHYEDPIWPGHLTGLTERTGVRFATWAYDERGRAVSSEHAGGAERVTFEHPEPADVEAGGALETVVTNSLGERSVYAWRHHAGAGEPRLLSASGPGCASCPPTGRRYLYDAAGRLASVARDGTDTVGDPVRIDYAYDALGRLLRVQRVDERGVTHPLERREYEDGDVVPRRVIRPSVNPAGERVVETVRDELGRPVRVVERGYAPFVAVPSSPSASVPTDSLAGSSAPPPAVDWRPIERTTRLRHDGDRLVAIDGPREDVADITRLEWDASARLVAIRPPAGPALHLEERDVHGRPTVLRLGTGSRYAVRYDASGEVAAIAHRAGDVAFERDAEGRITAYTDADGHVTRLERDAAGRAVSVTDPFGRLVRTERDSEGRESGQSFFGLDGELVRSVTLVRDALGRIERRAERRLDGTSGAVTSHATRLERDSTGRLVAAVDPASGTGLGIDIDIDPLGGRTILTGPDGAVTVHRVDALGQDAGLVDARGNATREYRDDFGQLVGSVSPDTGAERLERDAAGNVVRRVREDSGVTRYRHDAANRRVERTSRDGRTTWRHDPASGRPISVTDAATTERFAHDASGALTSHVREIDGHRFETTFRRDARGRIAVKRLPDGQTLRYDYHESGPARGTLRAITRERYFGLADETIVADIDLEPRDNDAGWVSSDDARTAVAFGANGRIRSMRTERGLDFAYRFDAADRLVGIAEDGVESRYGYASGRLVTAETADGASYRYEHDAVGNRLAHLARTADGTVIAERYAYAAEGQGNRLLERTDLVTGATHAWRHDAGGSPTEAGPLSYEYDAERRPVRVRRDGELLASYAYNGFGERVKKVVHRRGAEPRVSYFLYEDRTLVAEADAAGAITAQYLYLDDHRPIAKLEGGRTYAIHTDHLGTPRRMTDEDGRTVWAASYTPFGEARITHAEVTLALRLPGQYADAESGTHYNYLRDYDPALGRYLTSDPIGLRGGALSYAYAGLDPLGASDPLGLFERPSVFSRLYWQVERSLVLAAVDGPAPAGDVVAVLWLVYELGEWVGGQLVSPPAFAEEDLRAGHDELVQQIRLYDPGYSELRDDAWSVGMDDLHALSRTLYELQLDEVALGECGANYAAARGAVDFVDALRRDVLASRTPMTEWLEREFADYRANGGEIDSLSDWMAAGMPEARLTASQADPDNPVANPSFVAPDGTVHSSEAAYRAARISFGDYRQAGGREDFATWHLLGQPSSPPPLPTLPPERPEIQSILDALGSTISSKQYRHVYEHPDWVREGGKSYLQSYQEAQEILDALKQGRATILGVSAQGHLLVTYANVTGTNVNVGVGVAGQPTNMFLIKGTKNPSVVPTSPTARPAIPR